MSDSHISPPSPSPPSPAPPHFAVIPWMAQGHFIPMVDIARLLAERHPAAAVTVITTPGNAARIAGTIARVSASSLPLHFATLRFPSLEAGLPEGCENLDSIPCRDMARNFFDAAKLLRPTLEALLRDLRPSCIIAGIGFPWLDTVSNSLNIPRLVFQGFSSFALVANHSLYKYLADVPVGWFELPGMLHSVKVTASQLPQFFDKSSKFIDIYQELHDGELTSDGFIVNSFHELEPGYSERLEAETGKNVWTIGPVSLCNRAPADAAERGNVAVVGEEETVNWLNDKEAGSVVYVSFGSMGKHDKKQMVEIGEGLAATRRPFVWVVRTAPEVEKWLAELEERMLGRCLLIRGWAPQVMILSHSAVGGFITHCGWNSTLEGVSAGIPMITWPLAAEQFLNEKLAVEVLEIAVSVREVNTECSASGIVERFAVMEAVERLMDGGEEGEERRRRVRQLGEMAGRAMEVGGSSYMNVTRLLQYVEDHHVGKDDIEVL